MTKQFQVGDLVDAYDLRDGAKIEANRKIEKLETHAIPQLKNGTSVDVPKPMALLSGCRYWIPVRCLRRRDQ